MTCHLFQLGTQMYVDDETSRWIRGEGWGTGEGKAIEKIW